jgi:hypothetical protein
MALLAGFPLAAKPVITLKAPRLNPGYENLQSLLDQKVASFSADFGSLIEKSLDKPLLMRGFNGAATQAVIVPAGIHATNFPYIMLGSAASFYSPGLSTEVFGQMKSLNPESDYNLGLCIQPVVVKLGIPLDFALPGLSISADAGYMDANAGVYGIGALTAGLAAEYAIIRPKKGMIAWDGISTGLGADYARNKLTALVTTGKITQIVPIDPDGDGPLAPFTETIVIDPSIRAGIESNAISLRLGATTGATFFRALSLYAGGGVSLGFARSGILLDASGTISVTEYLAGLMDKGAPGTFSITGTAAEQNSFSVAGYVAAGVKFRVGFFDLSVPVVIRPMDSIGAGVFIGVHL